MRRGLLLLAFLPAVALAQPAPPSSANCGKPTATCKAGKFSLLAGAQLCLNSTTCTTIISASATTAGMVFNSGVANSSTNVAYAFNTTNTLSGSTSLMTMATNGTVVMSVLPTGKVQTTRVGGAFAPNYGIEFPTADNTIFYRTGSVGGGAHRFTDIGGNVWVDFYFDGVHFGTSVADARLFVRYSDSSGTPGAAIINRIAGRSAVAAAAASVVITNSTVTATSVVAYTFEDLDTTCTRLAIVPIAGSFTATCPAAATAITKFRWWQVVGE